MKKLFLLGFGIFVSTLVTAQTIHIDIEKNDCKFVNDSLIIQLSISGNIEDLNSRDAIVLTPFISSQNKSDGTDLQYIQLNGKYKQILYVRNKEMRNRMKSSDGVSSQYVQGLNSNGKFSVDYKTSVAVADWMNNSFLQIRCENLDVNNDAEEISVVFVREIENLKAVAPVANVAPAVDVASIISTYVDEPQTTSAPEPVQPTSTESKPEKKLNYKGSYIAPSSDATDERNQRDLNFSLEEAQVMVNVNPNILSLKELFTVAMSYKEDREMFYSIILTCVQLYPTHPIANLNAASMSIELGDTKSANKYLQIAPYESLAYKNCRGAYELMNGNTYEGIRLLKSAKADGSEEAGYNLELFFKQNKK